MASIDKALVVEGVQISFEMPGTIEQLKVLSDSIWKAVEGRPSNAITTMLARTSDVCVEIERVHENIQRLTRTLASDIKAEKDHADGGDLVMFETETMVNRTRDLLDAQRKLNQLRVHLKTMLVVAYQLLK